MVPSAGHGPFELDYALALQRVAGTLTTIQRDVLAALITAPGDWISGGEIALQLGLRHHASVNTAVVGLARSLTKAVGAAAPSKRDDGSTPWWRVVAEGRYEGRLFRWRLRPKLRGAAIAAGMAAPAASVLPILPEEITEEPCFEGAVARVLVNAYERDPEARRRCIAHHGTACAACERVLADVYGPIAVGLIHVHHLRPLSECGGRGHQVDPVTDLRPVCPNCHAVLHRRRPPLAIEELQALLASRLAPQR